jgi:superfamily II DNA or RNA helicase
MDRELVKNRLLELVTTISKGSLTEPPYCYHKQIIKLIYKHKMFDMKFIAHWIFDQYSPTEKTLTIFFRKINNDIYKPLKPTSHSESSSSLACKVFGDVAEIENANEIQHEIGMDLAKWILKRLVFQTNNHGEKKASLIIIYSNILYDELNPQDVRQFIPYPEISDKHFQKKILQKSEFRKFKYPKHEPGAADDDKQCNKILFERTLNQNFLRNFISPMTPYNGVLLYHGVGVGKSCSAISIAEQFHNVFEKKTLILMPSSLKDNFKKQIFDLDNPHNSCTGKTYYNSANYTALNKDIVEKKISKHILSKYEMKGFMEFANSIGKMKVYEGTTTEIPAVEYQNMVREECSNRVIIIDEVHNVREGDGGKQVPPILNDVFKYADNIKLILLSATPMYNDATEIIDVINLLLLNDKKTPIDTAQVFEEDKTDKVVYASQTKTMKLRNDAEKTLGEKSKGYISYMRSENPYTFPMRLYPTTATTTTIKEVPLVECDMSKHQKNKYDIAEVTEDADKKKKTSDNAQRFQVSNIAYPDAQGATGFSQVFQDENKSGRQVRYKDNRMQILDKDNLSKYSAKMDFIVDSILKSEGIVFIYSFYLHAGIIPLAIALEHRGFNNIGGNILVGGKVQNDDKTKPKNYTVISPQNKNVNADIEILKSLANVNGDKIKVVLGSSIATEGFDFKNIREIYILDPWWNLNRIEQIIGRAVRHCSHIALPSNKRNVTIYNMACRNTIDIKAYTTAAKKQKNIDQVERIIKKYAVDCNLNKHVMYYDPEKINRPQTILDSQGMQRNIKLGDTRDKFLPVKCNFHEKNRVVDKSTDDKYFYRDDLEKLTLNISNMYNDNLAHSFHDIKNKLTMFDHNNIAYALNEMVNNKIPIKNDLSGYLIYRGDMYIFQPFYSENLGLPLVQRSKHTKLKVNVIKVSKPEKIIKDVESILTKLKSDILDLTERIGDNASGLEDPILDYYVDRLTTDEVLTLIKHRAKYGTKSNTFLQQITTSLIHANVVHESSVYTYVRDVTSENIYFVDKVSGDAEIAEHFLKLKDNLELKTTRTLKEFHGFIETSDKKGAINIAFKVIDTEKTSSSGTVCSRTSTLKKETLVDAINLIRSKRVVVNASTTKDSLCDLYELALREQKTLFARPMYAKLSSILTKKMKKTFANDI